MNQGYSYCRETFLLMTSEAMPSLTNLWIQTLLLKMLEKSAYMNYMQSCQEFWHFTGIEKFRERAALTKIHPTAER